MSRTMRICISKGRKVIAFILCFMMCFTFIPFVDNESSTASAATSIEIGDYVQMGTYYGEPIIWRCVDIDENGPLMLSDKILCLKAFDAGGNVRSGSHGRGYLEYGMKGWSRMLDGSNCWEDSNIRCWLNSTASAGNVNWTCGNPPDKTYIYGEENEYKNENGFLSNFTKDELVCMKKVNQAELLDNYEYDNMKDYGSEFHEYNMDIEDCVKNFDSSYKKIIVDTVFLLDVRQVNKVWQNRSALGNDYYIGEPTAKCVANSEYTNSNLATGKKWMYWLRTPFGSGERGSLVREIDEYGNVVGCMAYSTAYGIRPAFYLNPSSTSFVSGNGSEGSPYTVAGGCQQSEYNKTGVDSAGNSIKACVKEYSTLKKLKDANFSLNGKSMSVSLDGYEEVSISNCTLKCSGSLKTMDVALVPKYRKTYIAAVHCNNKDALVNDTKIPVGGGAKDIYVYSSLPSGEISKYELLLDNTVLLTSTDGHFSFNPKTVQPSKKLSVRVVKSDGTKCNSINTSISVKDNLGKTPKVSTNCEFTIPDSVPVLGGGKFNLDFSSLCPIVVQQDEDRILIGIGCKQDLLKGGSTSSDWFNWKKFVTKQSDNLRKGLNQYMVASNGNLVSAGPSINFDSEVVGYAEGTVKDGGGISQVNGYLSISIKGSRKNEWQTVVVNVPIVIKFKAEAGLSAVSNIGMNIDSAEIYLDGTIDLTLPKIKLSSGVGIAHVADISVYGSAKNMIEFKSSKPNALDYVDASLSGELGICATALIFSADVPLLDGSWSYYHWPYAKSSLNGVCINESELTKELLDEDSYKIDRSYLNTQSEWYTAGKDGQGSKRKTLSGDFNKDGAAGDDDGITVTTLQQSVYNSANPLLLETDSGLKMLVWNADIKSRTTGNHIAAVYSIFDKTTGLWSEPQIIEDDGTADGYISGAAYGDKIYLAWTDEKRDDLTRNTEMAECAAGCEISTAVYDENSGKFSVSALTSDSYADLKPVVYAGSNGISAAWIKNKSNDMLGMSGTNVICYSQYNNGWTNVSEYKSFSKPVSGLDVGSLGTKVNIAYTLDSDGDISTSGDREIYIGALSGEPSKITNNETDELSIQFAELNSKSVLAWYQDGSIVAYDGNSTKEYTGEVDSVSANFKIANNQLYSIIAEDEGSKLYQSRFGEDSIEGATAISDNDDYIGSFSVLAGTNSTEVVYTKKSVEIDESSVSESTDICMSEISNFHDITLLEASADENGCTPGGTVPVTLKIKNNGLYDESGVEITASLSGEERLSETINETIKKGETTEVTVNLPLEEVIDAESEYEIKIFTSDGSDRDSSDNNAEVTVGYADLQIYADLLRSGNMTKAKLSISNIGLVDTSSTVNAYNEDGELLESFSIDKLESGESGVYEIDESMLPELVELGSVISFGVESDCKELSTGDNVSMIYISNAFENTTDIVLSEDSDDDGNLKITAKLINATGNLIEGGLVLGVYNSLGQQVGVQLENITAANKTETTKEFRFGFKKQEGYQIKAYLMKNGTYEPLL